MCLLSLQQTASVYSVETCQMSYPTSIRPKLFREGDWIDQLRVFSGNSDYVSQLHPNETVSLFLAMFKTNCGFWDMKTLGDDEFELSKGYYVPRFREHFYPFQVKIKRNSGDSLKIDFFLEKLLCDDYERLTAVVEEVNILRTDYSSYIVIHQCIDGNYLMLLTKKEKMFASERKEIERFLIGVMQDFKIEIENRTFWWPTIDMCDK